MFRLMSLPRFRTLLSFACAVALVASSSAFAADVKTLNVAHIELKGSYPEGPQSADLFGALTEGFSDLQTRLKRASEDNGVSAVILELKNPTMGWAKVNGLRQSIVAIRKTGKPVYAVIEMGTSKDYLIATACDKIVMPESGALMLLGLRAEVGFYKNLFDKIGIQPDMLRVGEYKSAAEPYTRTEMSPEFREEMQAILDDYYRQIVGMVTSSRKLDEVAATRAINSGPHTASAAKELGLIDFVAYEDELPKLIRQDAQDAEVKVTRDYSKKKVDTDFSGLTGMVKMMNLMMGVENQQRRTLNPKIAIIHATGAIMTGKSSSGGLFGMQTLGSETFIKAVKKAAEDDSVKAVVLRVDSPGGSALASDLMWRSLDKLGKPLVVSMGDVAASGGYYISMGADRIFAEPGTLTGSIGVVGGKLALQGLYEKIGITTTVLTRGENSGVMSTLSGFSDSERAALTKMLHEVYAQFTTKAAAGRKMELEKLEKLARGRVYTGVMAKEVGLVDELGTLEDAIAHAQRLAGLKADEKIERLILPKAPSPFEELFGPVDANARLEGKSPLIGAAAESLGPEVGAHLRSLNVIEMLAREPKLTLLPFRLEIK